MVRRDGQVPFRVVKDMNRSNPGVYWLRRYDEKGQERLKDRAKSDTCKNIQTGRIQDKDHHERKQPTTLDHKTGRRTNRRKKWNKISLYQYIPHTL